jgi:hypothetical protein
MTIRESRRRNTACVGGPTAGSMASSSRPSSELSSSASSSASSSPSSFSPSTSSCTTHHPCQWVNLSSPPVGESDTHPMHRRHYRRRLRHSSNDRRLLLHMGVSDVVQPSWTGRPTVKKSPSSMSAMSRAGSVARPYGWYRNARGCQRDGTRIVCTYAVGGNGGVSPARTITLSMVGKNGSGRGRRMTIGGWPPSAGRGQGEWSAEKRRVAFWQSTPGVRSSASSRRANVRGQRDCRV